MFSIENKLIDSVCSHLAGCGPSRRALIGLSGGVDSMVLLHACSLIKESHLLEVDFLAVHVNHGLSQEADDWEEHCRLACLSYGIPFASESLSLSTDMPNLEAVARESRYQCFKKHAADGITPLLLAHHQDDLVETFMLNLVRGSGVDGLSSLKGSSVSHGLTKLRPFLFCGKSDLINYAAREKLSWVSDPSNLSSKFDRNYLRNEVIPDITSRWPIFSRSVKKTADHLQDDAELLSEVALDKLRDCLPLGANCPLVMTRLNDIPYKWRSRVVIEWLRMNNIHYFRKTQVDAILAMEVRNSKSGNDLLEIDGNIIRKCRQCLVVWRPEEIFSHLKEKLPCKDAEKLEEYAKRNTSLTKKLRKISPKSSWGALPLIMDSNGLSVVDLTGRLHKISHNIISGAES